MVYRTTISPLISLRREMDRFFDDALAPAAAGSWSPAVDVREEPEAWVFEVELPGVDPAAVEVTTDQGVLTIRGEKSTLRQEGQEGRWHAVERLTGSFRRSFRLPHTVAEDRIEAQFTHGLLTIRAAKAEVPKPKRIEVKA